MSWSAHLTGTAPGAVSPAHPHATPEERAALGRALRKAVPRSAHAEVAPPSERQDPVALLEDQAARRVPELVPVRHGRMLQSAFAFYRGGAVVMASDLSRTPSTGLAGQICGDAHLANFGLFGSPERHLVFDLNDFDETSTGPWEWDVKRLAASIVVAARARSFTDKEQRCAVLDTVESYRTEMGVLAGLSHLEAWYRHVDAEEALRRFGPQLERPQRRKVARTLEKARSHDSLDALGKLTRTVGGEARIVSNPPVVVPIEELLSEPDRQHFTELLGELVVRYRATLRPDVGRLLSQYRMVHLAHKVVGVGSVGTQAWIALFLGRDGNDPLFLQAKEAQDSVVQQFLDPGGEVDNGARVVTGQHLLQAASDVFLGWAPVHARPDERRDFYIRQLRDWKGSVDLERLVPSGLSGYGRLCGVTLARAHARSFDRIALAAYLGTGRSFDVAIAEFAARTADQNERDFTAFAAAVEAGRLSARVGV